MSILRLPPLIQSLYLNVSRNKSVRILTVCICLPRSDQLSALRRPLHRAKGSGSAGRLWCGTKPRPAHRRHGSLHWWTLGDDISSSQDMDAN